MPVRIRTGSIKRIRAVAARHRITVVDAIAIAIELFESLPVDERRRLIDGEPRRKRRSKS